jgi:hypothetical protein
LKKLVFIFLLLTLSISINGQKSISIKKATSEIILDGELNEVDWITADKATDFQMSYPIDTAIAKTQTVVFVTFDDNNFYIAAICYDSLPNKKYTVQSLKRDFSFPISDAFAVFIDPFDDKINGFSFSVNPYGVQREGLVQSGGSFGVTTNWDNKWYSEVKRYEDKWIVEMKIPFKTIRYNNNLTSWGINFARNDLKRNETSTWNSVPRQYNVASLAFTGQLNWDTNPKKAGTNISIIPYTIGSYSKDFESNDDQNKFNGGFDAKIAVTSSLNLDITVNPDFSQVEVDKQITNLSRFSLFFPERRQFFIENSDLFSQFGFRQIRPFFSRRIGLKNGAPVPIIGGARLSGKINNNWRIGLMNMQTEGVPVEIDETPINPENFTVAAIQRKIGKRSSIDAIFVNRQGIVNTQINYGDYNRIAGLQYNLRSLNNKVQGKTFYNQSFSPNTSGNDYTHASWLMYNSEKITVHWNHEFVGENHKAEVGFIPRLSQYNTETNEIVYTSYWRFEDSFDYRFYPNSENIQNIQTGIYYSEYVDKDFTSTERELSGNFEINFNNRSVFKIKGIETKILLPFPTDITFSDNTPINSGLYTSYEGSTAIETPKFKVFHVGLKTNYGQYFIGHKLSSSMHFNYRLQPWAKFGIAIDQNKIWMPENFNDASLWLVGPKLEFSFTKKVFFTTFIQYNTQVENVNINARFQYRFKPMSDLYIVYTDNYNSPNFAIKNRALVVKLIYWINL